MAKRDARKTVSDKVKGDEAWANYMASQATAIDQYMWQLPLAVMGVLGLIFGAFESMVNAFGVERLSWLADGRLS